MQQADFENLLADTVESRSSDLSFAPRSLARPARSCADRCVELAKETWTAAEDEFRRAPGAPPEDRLRCDRGCSAGRGRKQVRLWEFDNRTQLTNG